MEEFQNLNWSWRAYASDVDLEKSYNLDMHENAAMNLADVFHSNLLQIESSHLIDNYHQQKLRIAEQDRNKSLDGETKQQKFIDPRTQITIPTFICDHRDVNLAARNILLEKCIEKSQLSAAEHSACLQAIQKLRSDETALSTRDKAHRSTYFATIQTRFDEKTRFLAFLKRNYFGTLPHRFHSVHPAVDSFITYKWKRKLLEVRANTTETAYRISTALKINCQIDDEIKAELIHQEHYGNVPKLLCDATILRQSSENLLRAYRRHRSDQFMKLVRDKTIEIADANHVNAIMPLSVIKLLIANYDIDWSVRMAVKDAGSSTILNPTKEITFKKPLPPLYLPGNDRRMIGNKYVLRTTVCPKHTSAFSHSTKATIDSVTSSDEVIECATAIDNPYKLHTIDDMAAKHLEGIDPVFGGNCSFRIWALSNGNDTIRLMIPAKTDAFRIGGNGTDIEMVNLSSKSELQAEFGAEVMTKAELLREWCHQYFRPDSITLRFRCDAESGQIIKTEVVKLEEIEASLRNLYGIERKTLLKYIWTSIQTFLNFPNGGFLLRHNRTDDDMIKVYQNCAETEASVTMESIYEKITFEKSQFDKIDWLPIDEQIITDIHITANVLPCAFPPTAYYESSGIGESTSGFSLKAKTQKGPKTPLEMPIKPSDDSGWVAKRLEKRKTTLSKPQRLRKSQKNAAKRQKQRVKALLKKAEKNVQQSDANELATLKEISVDEYKAVDKPIEPLTSVGTLSEPRLTRKRASQRFAAGKAKTIDIVSAQHEIAKRRASGFVSPSPCDSSVENQSSLTTRSGRIVRTRPK